ncbi:PAAR domain-containing protein [Pseudomonas sp. KU26590]|uniref:PAAR domain-containing protein n=1 Tax=Pseudomonas sp. KU26590 TaxID=2991051 RepID=UPI00223D05D5|nr:PAAR domain-containing protein [Pseudomonas sp. KU26590]UZJ60147.1 PAAR domain-containing protein [Pseudomonas sp. KU26590]
MTYVVREGDSTTTGGVVLSTSGSHTWEDRRLARMGDPVWCEQCAQIGFIAQGNPTFIDELVAVATHGQAVRCGCAEGNHRLIASQNELQADMDATIDIPKDMAEKARKRAKQMTRSRRESPEPLA